MVVFYAFFRKRAQLATVGGHAAHKKTGARFIVPRNVINGLSLKTDH
jgi:hypothetical protein